MTVPRPSTLDHLRLARKANDIAALLDALHDGWGEVVDFGYRSVRMTAMFGTAANRFILSEHADNFLWGPALQNLEAVNGPTALVLSDGVEHKRRRRLVQPAFAKRRVDAHLDLAVREFDHFLDGWTPGRRLDAFADVRPTVRRIVVRALFGDNLGADADRIGDALEPALRYVNRNPLLRFDVDLGVNGYAKTLRARREVDAIALAEIGRRRAAGIDVETHPDTLTAMLAAEADDATGAALRDDEICDQLRSLIAAGYDTTTSSAAWLVHGLGANPTAFDALRAQVRDSIGDRAPTIEDIRSMPLVDGVVRETLRLWPPGTLSVREPIEAFEFAGHTVDAGTLVAYSPYITHRLPDVWGDPTSFRPERWADGEPEPFSFVPFGGGGRMCIGFALAALELQVLAVRLAQRATWTNDGPEPRSAAIASFAPTGGMPITVTG